MGIKSSFVSRYMIAVLMCSIPYFTFSQTNTEKQVQQVFNQLISVYGSAKSVPQLEIVKKGKFPIQPARYLPSPNPKIEVDEALYKLCQTFGKDSLNALAIVLSHELTHHYNDHLFCSDYAYANLYSNNPTLAKTLKTATLSSRVEKESEADIKGFFYAAAAGYQPFGIQNELINRIYKAYNLPDIQKGYPTKQERIAIALSAEKTANELYDNFKKGLQALENKQYDAAISYFNNANAKVPFRENLNNIGVARVRKALELKARTKGEVDFPKRFQYPLEVDNSSRLQQEIKRSLDSDSEIMESELIAAQKDFEEAIRLDPSYTKSHINLACVYDLLGKHLSAIAEITEKLSKDEQNSIAAKQILAIAYYNADMEKKAEEIWRELKM